MQAPGSRNTTVKDMDTRRAEKAALRQANPDGLLYFISWAQLDILKKMVPSLLDWGWLIQHDVSWEHFEAFKRLLSSLQKVLSEIRHPPSTAPSVPVPKVSKSRRRRLRYRRIGSLLAASHPH